MYGTAKEALALIKEYTLKSDMRGRGELILRTAPQYCNSAINFNLMNVQVGGMVHKDKLDGTPYGSEKVKFQCIQLVPEERKFDLTILNDTAYFQPYQHLYEVSEFYPKEYVLKDCLRTLQGVLYRAVVAQPQVWSANAFSDITKWELVESELV